MATKLCRGTDFSKRMCDKKHKRENNKMKKMFQRKSEEHLVRELATGKHARVSGGGIGTNAIKRSLRKPGEQIVEVVAGKRVQASGARIGTHMIKRSRRPEEYIIELAVTGKLARASRVAIGKRMTKELDITFQRGNKIIKRKSDGTEKVLAVLKRSHYFLPPGVGIIARA